ncbi:MAG: Gfo/Idh/MocA family oxidoreductase, partial [Saprospiraceae bacterium]
PMCLSLEELDKIENAATENGLTVMEAFMHLHHPQTHLWKSIIDEGRIGELRTMQSCFCFNFDRDKDNYRWNADQGGGALWDVGVYPISLFQYLFGTAPENGLAFMYSENGIDLSTSAILDYGKGITGQFFVSFRSAYSTDTVIHGAEAQLYISHPFNNVDSCKAFIKRNDEIEIIDVPRQYLYSGEVENMHDVVLESSSPFVTLKQSRDVLKTILLLREK